MAPSPSLEVLDALAQLRRLVRAQRLRHLGQPVDRPLLAQRGGVEQVRRRRLGEGEEVAAVVVEEACGRPR